MGRTGEGMGTGRSMGHGAGVHRVVISRLTYGFGQRRLGARRRALRKRDCKGYDHRWGPGANHMVAPSPPPTTKHLYTV